jgi:hypothetical protein
MDYTCVTSTIKTDITDNMCSLWMRIPSLDYDLSVRDDNEHKRAHNGLEVL